MKRYLVSRFIRSVLSIFVVITIVLSLIYTFIPRDRVFFSDPLIGKLQKRPDDYDSYRYLQWEQLGYLEYETINDYCATVYEPATGDYNACIAPGSLGEKEFKTLKERQGYTVKVFQESHQLYAYKDIPLYQRVITFWTNLIQIDHPNKVSTDLAPDLNREIYIGKDHENNLALMCNGCENKYLVYVNDKFPYVHQNVLTFNLGVSYPTFAGDAVLDVMTQEQGKKLPSEITLPTGQTANSALNLHSCQYKPVLDNIDSKQFTDHYADCETFKADSSMMEISFTIGIISLIITYVIGIPVGVSMALHKGRLIDRMGNWYIIFMMAIPSLAYISLVRFIGGKYFELPTMFPMYGSGDWRSYVLPIVSLTLGSLAGIMMWTRRYVVDQSNMDYVKFAKAKGLSSREIFSRHILRNAIGPIMHGIPGAIIFCIAGALVTETVYAIPGMGKILPDSISIYNNSMVLGVTFIFTVLAILSTFLGDVLLTLVDPRISLHDKGGEK